MELAIYNIKLFSTTSINYIIISSNMQKIKTKTRRNRRHHKVKRQYKTESDDDPAGSELLSIIVSSAEFTNSSKLGFFSLYEYSVGCRSPPLVLHFSDLKI